MSVPYVFGTATAAIPLSQLDSNFNTTITLGNTAIQLGNTVTTLNNMTLANVTVTSGTSNLTSTTISNGTSNVAVASSGGNINLTTAGTRAVTIDTSQNVGIGTSSPGTKLTVSTGVAGNLAYFTDAINADFYIKTASSIVTIGPNAGSTNLAFQTSGTERARIDSSGNLGIGMTPTNFGNGYTVLQVANATNGGMLYLTNTSNAGGRIYGSGAGITYDAFSTTYHAFNTNSAEAMRIDSSGNVLVGTTGNVYGSRLNVKSSGDNVAAEFYRQGTSSSSGIVVFNSNSGGTETLKSYIDVVSGLIVASSDQRLKKNIIEIGYGLQQISALRPVSFKWISGDGKTNLGFIAQEVETVIPEAVTTLDLSMSKTIDNQKMLSNDALIPVLVKAIQEQQALITSLTTRITALENK